jgi:hypothetical protein
MRKRKGDIRSQIRILEAQKHVDPAGPGSGSLALQRGFELISS